MVLADGTGRSFEAERVVEGSVANGLDQDQLCQGENVLVLPDVEVFKF